MNYYKVSFVRVLPDKKTAGKTLEIEYVWNVEAEDILAARKKVIDSVGGDVRFREVLLKGACE